MWSLPFPNFFAVKLVPCDWLGPRAACLLHPSSCQGDVGSPPLSRQLQGGGIPSPQVTGEENPSTPNQILHEQEIHWDLRVYFVFVFFCRCSLAWNILITIAVVLNGVRDICVIYLFVCLPRHAACSILVPQPGMEPVPPAVEVWSLNHWTAREVPLCDYFW